MGKILLLCKKKYYENRTWITFVMGLLVVSFSIIPYFYLKEKIWISIHDNLDSQVLNYIYNAKYLFSDTKIIPEVMNGLSRDWFETPAPFLVLFYKLLSPFYAYTAAQYFVVICGYTGMFLLIHEITNHEDEISFVVASIFCYLPFYNIYGLTILGQALLAYAFLNLYNGKKKVVSIALICFFASASSLALAGFALIGVLIIADVWLIIRGKWLSKIHFFIGICALILTYCCFNIGLIKGVLGLGQNTVSHREEYIKYGTDFWPQFINTFFDGDFYTTACNRYIVFACMGMLVIKIGVVIFQKVSKKEVSNQNKNIYISIFILFFMNIIISMFSSFLKTFYCADIRNKLGGVLSYFQFERVTWLLPTSWFVIFAMLLFLIIKDYKILHIGLRYYIVIILALIISWQVYNHSFIWHHLRLMLFPQTYHLTRWEDIYAQDVYSQIKDAIGEDQSEYRVVSLGIYPSTALYNGFYCLDGYSNNYPLEYKHEFRKAIEKELDRDPVIKQYFDEWGNRCYLMCKESGYYEMIEKKSNFVYQDLQIDTEVLKSMGCEYIFSAGIIENNQELNIELLQEEPFETKNSFFAVYVYKIK